MRSKQMTASGEAAASGSHSLSLVIIVASVFFIASLMRVNRVVFTFFVRG